MSVLFCPRTHRPAIYVGSALDVIMPYTEVIYPFRQYSNSTTNERLDVSLYERWLVQQRLICCQSNVICYQID